MGIDNSDIKEKLIKIIEAKMHQLNRNMQPLQIEISELSTTLNEMQSQLNIMIEEMSDLEKQKGWILTHE